MAAAARQHAGRSVMDALESIKMPEVKTHIELTPTVHTDMSVLASFVMGMHATLQQHNSVLSLIEKEMSKQKMELDLGMRNLRHELEAKLQHESKKRSMDIQKIRLDFERMQEDIAHSKDAVDQQFKAQEDKIAEVVERLQRPLKASLMDNTVQCKTLEDALKRANAEHASHVGRSDERMSTLAGHTERLQQLLDNVHGLFNVSPDQVGLSVKHRTQMELLKGVPLVKDILSMINSLETKQRHDEAQAQDIIVDMDAATKKLWARIDSVDSLMQALSETMTQNEQRVNNFTKSISSNFQYIKDGCAMKSDLEYMTSQVEFQDSLAKVNHLDKRLQDQLDTAMQEREAIAKELQKKSDWDSLVTKADKEEVTGKLQKLTLNFKTLNDIVDDVQDELAKIREEGIPQGIPAVAVASPLGMKDSKRTSAGWVDVPQTYSGALSAGGDSTRAAPPRAATPSTAATTPIRPVAPQPAFDTPRSRTDQDKPGDAPCVGAGIDPTTLDAVTAVTAATAQLDARMEAAETAIGILDGVKVSRDDVWCIAKEVVAEGVAVGAGAQVTPQPKSTGTQRATPEAPSFPTDSSSTALRFRCLSCNRTAGGLVDESGGGAGQAARFPPSSTLNTLPGGGSGKVPSPSATQGYSTTRKKLLNYYDWLRNKSVSRTGSPSRPASATQRREPASPEESPRTGAPRSPSPHVWDGSQAGGGETRVRQSGDHGSNAPHAIGSDGRFYPGVKRPAFEEPDAASSQVAAHDDESPR